MGNLPNTHRNYLLSEADSEDLYCTLSFDSFQQRFLCNPPLHSKPLMPSLSSNISRLMFSSPCKSLGMLQELKICKTDPVQFLSISQYMRVLEFMKNTHSLRSPFFKYEAIEQLKNAKNTLGVIFQGFGISTLQNILDNRREQDAYYQEFEVKMIIDPLIEFVNELMRSNLPMNYLCITKELMVLTMEGNGTLKYRLLGFEPIKQGRNETLLDDLKGIAREMLGLKGKKDEATYLEQLFSKERPTCENYNQNNICESYETIIKIPQTFPQQSQNCTSNYDFLSNLLSKKNQVLSEKPYYSLSFIPDQESLRIYLDLLDSSESNLPLSIALLEEFIIRSPKAASLKEEAYWLNRYAIQLHKSGLFIKSLDILERVHSILYKLTSENSIDKAYLLNNIGVGMLEMGKLEASLENIKKADEIFSDDRKSLKTLKVMSNLGETLWRLGEFTTSITVQFQALQRKRLWFPEEKDSLFVSLNNLAMSFSESGDQKLGLKLLQEIRTLMNSKCLPNDHRVIFFNSMGVIESRLNELHRAAEMFTRGLEIHQVMGFGNKKRCMIMMKNLAWVEMKRGNREIALKLINRLVDVAKEAGLDRDYSEEIEEMKLEINGMQE